jgi:uncharacterized repeat protein (TIGR03843 family)
MPGKTTPKKNISPRSMDALALLSKGEMQVIGLVPWSSNYTFLVKIKNRGYETLAIYKPSSGERPLWDFPAGSLAKRECAAYLVSSILGWPNIPPTILRDGPEGEGAVQMFIDAVAKEHFFTLRATHREEMKKIAAFDAIANNTDRKGGHILLGKDDRIWCIDHGVTFHEYPKLRTVIWDFVGEKIPRPVLDDLRHFTDCLEQNEAFKSELRRLLYAHEISALSNRVNDLIEAGVYPEPPDDWPHVPWPPV